jgi:diguanylate cyclase (GGDEF)-like protein
MRLVTLTFDDAATEHRFRDAFWTEALPFAQVCCSFGVAIFGLFGVLDAVLLERDTLSRVWTIRFVIGMPVGILVLLISFFFLTKDHKRNLLMLSLLYLYGGSLVIAMISVVQPPVADHYYAGVIIALFGVYIFSQLRFVHATLSGTTLVLVCEIVAVLIKSTPPDVLISNTFFLISVNCMGMLASYTVERYRRQVFIQRSQLTELTWKLERLSAHDPLTGLLNRRQLSRYVQDEVDRHHAGGTPAAAMLIDLDDFKAVNDRFGHLAGDELLRRTARAIAATVRKGDLTFRYGGDEFFVLLPDTTLEQARGLAHRLVDRFQRFGSSTTGFEGAAGISIGVAALDHATPTADDVLNATDRALYEAKVQGKGRVAVVRAGSPIGRSTDSRPDRC